MIKRQGNGVGTLVIRQTKQGKVYQCKIRERGRYYCGTGKTQKEARDNARNHLENALERDLLDLKKERVEANIAKYFDRIAALRHWKESTRVSRWDNFKIINKGIGHVKVEDLDAQIINDFLFEISQNYCTATINKIYHILYDYVGFLYTNKHIFYDFTSEFTNIKDIKGKNVKKDIEHTIFEDYEITRLKEETGNPAVDYYSMLFYVMFLTGMRSQEFRALRWSDVDFELKTININKARIRSEYGEIEDVPKTRTSRRRIKINNETIGYLQKIQEEYANGEYICHMRSTDQPVSSRTMMKYLDMVLKKHGIEKNGRGVHTLRHTFISFAMSKHPLSPLKNKEFTYISRYVGHANPDITLKRYTHVTQNQLLDELDE